MQLIPNRVAIACHSKTYLLTFLQTTCSVTKANTGHALSQLILGDYTFALKFHGNTLITLSIYMGNSVGIIA